MPDRPKPLLFVDTNILLDFYRLRNEAGLKLLKRLEALGDRLICTQQVEMEFKKHRQRIILETLGTLKLPESLSPPAFLAEAAAVRAIHAQQADCKKRVSKLKDRLKKILKNPTTVDPVYKIAQHLFARTDELSLGRDKDCRHLIRRLARKRFALGYPPRKSSDTACGDAINWEWLVDCAKRHKADVFIVSRDSDYGVTIDNESYLNDWLHKEFKARVHKNREAKLFTKLSDALKAMEIAVSDQEVEEDEAIAEELPEEKQVASDEKSPQWSRIIELLRASARRMEAKPDIKDLPSGDASEDSMTDE